MGRSLHVAGDVHPVMPVLVLDALHRGEMMAILDVVEYPDPRLREVSSPIPEVDGKPQVTDEILELVADMKETMYAADGAGLAAIQVGRPLRLFVVDSFIISQDRQAEPVVFVNPEIVSKGGKQEGEEGCLSFPGVFVPISRAATCIVRAKDLDGKVFDLKGEELLARAFQHEIDHLKGKLIIDYVGRLKKRFIEKKMRRAAHK